MKLSISNKQTAILNAIYTTGYSPELDSKAHNRNVSVLRHTGLISMDNQKVTQLGMAYVTVRKPAKNPVTELANSTDDVAGLNKLTKRQLIAMLTGQAKTEYIGKHAKKQAKTEPESVKDIPNYIDYNAKTVEYYLMTDAKKRQIRVNTKFYEAWLQALKARNGELFASHKDVTAFNIDIAKQFDMITIVDKPILDDNGKIIDVKYIAKNNFEAVGNDSNLPLTHFLNSYCYTHKLVRK